MSTGVVFTQEQGGKPASYLLVLDSKKKTVRVTGFSDAHMKEAAEEYREQERASLKQPEIQTVLVSVDSIKRLRSAYPNFYLDTTTFVRLVRDLMR